MANHAARLLCLPPAVVTRRPPSALSDAGDYFDPDGVWVLGTERAPKAYAKALDAFDVPVVHPPLGRAGEALQYHDFCVVEVVTVQRADLLDRVPAFVAANAAGPADTPVFLVCDDISVSLDLTGLAASLTHAEQLAVVRDETPRELVVLTGAQPADYDVAWELSGEATGRSDDGSSGSPDDALRVHGMGGVEQHGPDPTVACLTLSSAGTVGVELVDSTAFGLEAVTHVGPKTAARLVDEGVRTRDDLAAMPAADLEALPGIGASRARRMKRHVEVLRTGRPLRLTAESLPGERGGKPPLCLDIETDGLSPTVIWQVGVYDPHDDSHRSFVERTDPGDPGRVLESFLSWLLAGHDDRALLTWNGWGFDYPHLTAFVGRYVPHFAEEWDAVPKFDLYDWAVREAHALLPGRTNKLDHVSRALGYEPAATGLDGAKTAAAYQRFVRSGEPLDWEHHEAYCEDDCRALWHVYGALRDADRDPGATTTADATARTRTTEQTGLDEF